MNPNFNGMTDEQRIAATQAREEKKLFAQQNYIQAFSDESFWRATASELGVRMPLRSAGPTEYKYIKRAAKKTGVSVDGFIESTGFTTLKSFCQSNPKWPQYALVGVFLEYAKEQLANTARNSM